MPTDLLEFWIDINLPDVLAKWIVEEYHFKAKTFKELNFQQTEDFFIFKKAAQKIPVVVITTKDFDFAELTKSSGNLPKVLYLNIGNVTNKQLRVIFNKSFPQAINLLTKTNQQLVEITNYL